MELRCAQRSQAEHEEITNGGKAHVIAAVQQNFHTVVAPAARQAYESQHPGAAAAAAAASAAAAATVGGASTQLPAVAAGGVGTMPSGMKVRALV